MYFLKGWCSFNWNCEGRYNRKVGRTDKESKKIIAFSMQRLCIHGKTIFKAVYSKPKLKHALSRNLKRMKVDKFLIIFVMVNGYGSVAL